MRIKSLLNQSTEILHGANIPSPDQEAEDIICFALKLERVNLITQSEQTISKHEADHALNLIKRRANHEPLAYILGWQPFRNFKFKVTPDVLIPRPCTEEFIDLIINEINKRNQPVKSLVEIGTGSGAIIISLAHWLKTKYRRNSKPNINTGPTIIATDISIRSLKIAQANAKQYQVNNINWRQGDLVTPIKTETIDILIANLPYVSEQDYTESPTTAELSYEPKTALVAADNGFALIETLLNQLSQSHTKITPKSIIALEIGHNHGTMVKTLATKLWPKTKTTIYADGCGFDRFAIIKF